MITKEQFYNGLIKYIDAEVMPALPTSSKWALGTAVALFNFNAYYDKIASNEVAKSFGIISDDGLIDAEKFADALAKSAEKYGKLQVNIPLVGILTFSSSDVAKAKQYILETSK